MLTHFPPSPHQKRVNASSAKITSPSYIDLVNMNLQYDKKIKLKVMKNETLLDQLLPEEYDTRNDVTLQNKNYKKKSATRLIFTINFTIFKRIRHHNFNALNKN